MQVPELRCLDPESFRKYFRALNWYGARNVERSYTRRVFREQRRRPELPSPASVCFSPALLNNPSQFVVYAAIRRSILSRWKHIKGAITEVEESDDESIPVMYTNIPKITGIGLRAVFSLVSQSQAADPLFCETALEALLDTLQGHAPEELSHEPPEIISHMLSMLIEIAAGSAPLANVEMPTNLTALGTSCLVSLVVARGDAEIILNAVASLFMTPKELAEQYVQIPVNLTTLQRSVQSVILGTPSRNMWLNYGVPQQSLAMSFPVELPPELKDGPSELVVRSIASDGCYLYVFTSRGLLKIGSGYGSSIKQHVYLYKPDFFPGDRQGWIGFCKNKLFVRIGRLKTEVYEIDPNTFEIKNFIKLDPDISNAAQSNSAVFSDGHQLGVTMLTNNNEFLNIRYFDVDKIPEPDTECIILTNRKEVNVPLLRKKILALGRATYEDSPIRRGNEHDMPIVMQLEDIVDDPLVAISGGAEFGLVTTASGKVYYSGKGVSLGYKDTPHSGRWTLINETLFTKNDNPNLRRYRAVPYVRQVSVGHEGVHAVMVLDGGSVLFTGIARRGEDGDNSKHRRTPKPTRLKKMYKVDSVRVVFAACNYGSTALVTSSGDLLMFGKDTQHCDTNGHVLGLPEKVTQVALGKAHAVVLTITGQIYTFGINNKGQCGREFTSMKEKQDTAPPDDSDQVPSCENGHTWINEYCRVCVQCHECTGFSNACNLSNVLGRVPGGHCGCGEGDRGCSVCGTCRQCADVNAVAAQLEPAEPMDATEAEEERDTVPDDLKDGSKAEGQITWMDVDRDAAIKITCLPPARVAIPDEHKISAIACGLHHTMLLTEHGEVLTFGSNQFGQLGVGNIAPQQNLVKVQVPKAASIAAGSNHSAVRTRDGEVYTFGNYQKGSLGRVKEGEGEQANSLWYATPAPLPRIGPMYACRAIWLSASGDQTFIQVSQSIIKTDTLFRSTVTGNSTTIILLPNQPEHSFKCVTVNKNEGTCNAWTGSEQVNFVNTLACLDPLYDVLWCYQPKMHVMKCYNILAFDSHKLQRCCNPDSELSENVDICYPSIGPMRRLEDFKNLDNFEVMCNNRDRPMDNIALADMSILNQELAIPLIQGELVTRMHIVLHLLGCMDSLIYVHDNKINIIACKREAITSPSAPLKANWLTVTRFENHGADWSYLADSVEAIRFMCDTDIVLGGYGLFGGRGDYLAKIKLFDIGHTGGNQEGDGDLIAESEDVVFQCTPRDRFPIMFDSPIPLVATRWYVAWVHINGPSSDCGTGGQSMVIIDDVSFHFKTSKMSNNGTDVNSGQLPSLLYNLAGSEHASPPRIFNKGEPLITLTKNLSRKVTVPCFKSLIYILTWSWNSFRDVLLDTNGYIPINYKKLTLMKHQKRLVYVIRASLRLIKSYVNEIFPRNYKKRHTQEYLAYSESIDEVKALIQVIVAEKTPTCSMLRRRANRTKNRSCNVQFALELTTSILKEAHETTTACFHAFYPTPTSKWNHLCSMLQNVRYGKVSVSHIRELTSTCAALCISRSLEDVLHYIVPVTQSYLANEDKKRPDSEVKKMALNRSLVKSATMPRSANSLKTPFNRREPKPSTSREKEKRCDDAWNMLDVIHKLLDIVMSPIKQQMMTRPCGQQHDHGEIKQNEALLEYCCKLLVRFVAELSDSASHINGMETATITDMVTPCRFMRINSSSTWNTGNGNPDAICFTVDRPGVMLMGVGVYCGAGKYEYSLELLNDVRRLNSAIDENATSNCWVSINSLQGTIEETDYDNDMAFIKFEKHTQLKEDVRYALRFCNHGERTTNGDCGLPTVKGPDGTTFRFASCSLSFNGTSLARGQIPCLIYNGKAARRVEDTVDTTNALKAVLRTITIRVSSQILERSVELFRNLRDELTTEDLRRNTSTLQQSPVVNTLIPYVLANLEDIGDSKNIVQLLELIYQLLPHVSALNLLVPSNEGTKTTTSYYTWVESDHPYQPSTIINKRVLFPSNISWIVLEMDPRSLTAQPEDGLTVYAVAGTPKQRCHCKTNSALNDPPFRKRVVHLTPEGEAEEMDKDDHENNCMHFNCTYVSVTPKLSNLASEWPQNSILVPGNEVVFSLETASDYLSGYNKNDSDENRFGFRCLCTGYEDAPMTTQRQGLILLEKELVYAGANWASKLLAPNLNVSPMAFPNLVDAKLNPMNNIVMEQPDSSVDLLLSGGLELSTPLSVHQVFDGQSLLRSVSNERQFLMDFIAGEENTAGGRLARWLAPNSRVEPSKCEIRGPSTPAQPAGEISLPIIIRDQYGDEVDSPSLKVEVVVKKLDGDKSCVNCTDYNISVPEQSFHPPMKDNQIYHTITVMRAFSGISLEELRLASGIWGDAVAVIKERVPVERLLIKPQPDGSYVVNWTPKISGTYEFRCTVDDIRVAQALTVDVTESLSENASACSLLTLLPYSPPAKIGRFAIQYTAGLRVRASPSLQAEELGRVANENNVAYVEEVSNKDGSWVRLNAESMRQYTGSDADVAWCLKHHRQLEKTLLIPPALSEESSEGAWSWPTPPTAMMDPEPGPSQAPDQMVVDEGSLQFASEMDSEEDANGLSPYAFEPEPSKRCRQMRNEASRKASALPRRRTNGNGLWEPLRHRPGNGRDAELMPAEDMELDSDLDSEPDQMYELKLHHDKPPAQAQEEAQAQAQYCERRPKTRVERLASLSNAPLRRPHLIGEGQSSPSRNPDAQAAGVTSFAIHKTSGSGDRSGEEPTLSSPPPLSPRTPKKLANSPAQAECLRAIFAALLWHEGIVHDAISCAVYLKFHPHLPKEGVQVTTRPPADVSIPRHQRHSVEVAGNYMRIESSPFESLTRSGEEASTSRASKPEAGDATREETHEPGPSAPNTINVLPPVMRAMVALWDALYDSDQLDAATDKYKQAAEEDTTEPSKVVDELAFPSQRIKWTNDRSPVKLPKKICELCYESCEHMPVAGHMRKSHPGCHVPTRHGYNRDGIYLRADSSLEPQLRDKQPSTCGQLIQELSPTYRLWYVYCERCRERSLKARPMTHVTPTPLFNSNIEAIIRSGFHIVDHNVMKDNAIFLLDLAPLANSESMKTAPWHESPEHSTPTPPTSMWQPAPSFQCLAALDAELRASPTARTAQYQSLGRPSQPEEDVPCEVAENGNVANRVHRSVSMGQVGEGESLNPAFKPFASNMPEGQKDTLPGAGLMLLAQPSTELLRLVSCGEADNASSMISAFEPSYVDRESLMKSPVLSFVLNQHDLPAFRQKLDAAVRISTVRQYAYEGLNWLMRSTSQLMCVHDVMWWFCASLDKYKSLVPPPEDNDENTENGEMSVVALRAMASTPSTSVICPGGSSSSGARAAFHTFLGSVSALAPLLPTTSAVALQAVRCWALQYSKHDSKFLQRSQIFSVISKILSQSEDGIYDDGFMGALNESFNSSTKESYLWACTDVTALCEISVSSRPDMMKSLTDGKTETFWESGDEDRNKPKWVQVMFSGGQPVDKPRIVCVHVDNTRDTAHRILMISFMYSGGSGEIYDMQDIDVDQKAAAWVCYTLPSYHPGVPSSTQRVRCEVRGTEQSVRVRQVRLLSAPAHLAQPVTEPARVIHSFIESDTLRVFRLLTTQVFGKLLEWEYSADLAEAPRQADPQADSNLREHVVGILFAGPHVTSLQRQVMSHIVSAIGGEAARVRDDWETAFICAIVADGSTEDPLRPDVHQQDNFCFEMLSLLLALSGSHVGRTYLTQQTELLSDLLALLHTASDRVQRQVIFLLRRMMMGITPQAMLFTTNQNSEERYTLLDNLLCYLAKAISIQVKVRGSSGPAGSVMMGNCVPGPQAAWFMQGRTTHKHAQLVIKLITDMAEDKISLAWGEETRSALALSAMNIAQVSEAERHPATCIALPTMWMALSSLCVCEQSHIELMKAIQSREAKKEGVEARPFCSNHDDGATVAVIQCVICGALCAECDRFLHLNRAMKAHNRQICKEEESAIRIDIHEGCGRAKLFWLMLLVDRRTLKGLAEFRCLENASSVVDGAGQSAGGASGAGLAGLCRFCGARGSVGLLAIGNVCADRQCQDFGASACNQLLACGHMCGGVRGEEDCLPCLVGCSRDASLRQDADDMCMICFTDPLQAAPSIQLGCGHVFHLHCSKKIIASKWNGPRVTFSFSQCPICKENIEHWALEELLAPIKRLREDVQRKALMRLKYDGLASVGAGSSSSQPVDPARYAMDRYAYYECHKCNKAYFGGLARCEAESNAAWEPSELVCGACSDVAGAKICPKHGADFLEYKCRYCCSVAVFFCFGTSHFCNPCHDEFQRVTDIPRQQLPQCPVGPKAEQLPGTADACPLHVAHPPTGEEFALGCGVCRHAQIF